MDPADYVEGKKQMIPLPTFTKAELQNAVHRTFEFDRGGGGGSDNKPWSIKTVVGQASGMA